MHNILFIGGAGFIGSNLIKKITDKKTSNYSIYIMEPKTINIDKNIETNISVIKGSLSDISLLNKIIINYNIDIVVHLVSTLLPNSTFEDYKQELQNIVLPTFQLIELCSKKGIKFIYFSSGGTIYGNNKTSRPFKETDELAPISYYGLSKQMIENYILFEHRTNKMNYLILRPSNPFGIGQSINGRQGLIAVSIGKILSYQPIEIYGNGKQIRDYIYIDDLSEIFYQLLEADISNNTFNISSGIGYTINEILHFLKYIVKEKMSVKYLPSRNSDVSNMILDNSHLKEFISFDITPIEKGILEFYSHIKNIQ